MKLRPYIGLAAITTLGSLPVSAATILFADTFDRANDSNLNAVTTGKSGALGTVDWVEKSLGTTAGNTEILNNRLNLNGGSAANLSHVPYVNHNFNTSSGVLTTITVAFDFMTAINAGTTRYLGFSIGNTVGGLNSLTSSNPFGDVSISYDHANTSGGVPNDRGIHIHHGGILIHSFVHTLSLGDTLSATFTFANMNAGTAISYQVFDEETLIYTSSPGAIWSGTNENYIGLFNTHGSSTNDNTIDNFVVSVPEPRAALLGSLGLLALLRRRR